MVKVDTALSSLIRSFFWDILSFIKLNQISISRFICPGADHCEHPPFCESRGETLWLVGSNVRHPWPFRRHSNHLKNLLLLRFETLTHLKGWYRRVAWRFWCSIPWQADCLFWGWIQESISIKNWLWTSWFEPIRTRNRLRHHSL